MVVLAMIGDIWSRCCVVQILGERTQQGMALAAFDSGLASTGSDRPFFVEIVDSLNCGRDALAPTGKGAIQPVIH